MYTFIISSTSFFQDFFRLLSRWTFLLLSSCWFRTLLVTFTKGLSSDSENVLSQVVELISIASLFFLLQSTLPSLRNFLALKAMRHSHRLSIGLTVHSENWAGKPTQAILWLSRVNLEFLSARESNLLTYITVVVCRSKNR